MRCLDGLIKISRQSAQRSRKWAIWVLEYSLHKRLYLPINGSKMGSLILGGSTISQFLISFTIDMGLEMIFVPLLVHAEKLESEFMLMQSLITCRETETMFGKTTETAMEDTVLIGVLRIRQQIVLTLRKDSPTVHVQRPTIIQDWNSLPYLMGHLIFIVKGFLTLGAIHSS